MEPRRQPQLARNSDPRTVNRVLRGVLNRTSFTERITIRQRVVQGREAIHEWRRGRRPGFAGAVSRLRSGGGRKHRGSTSNMRRAHPSAALSQKNIPIRPYNDPAREGLQSPRVTGVDLREKGGSIVSP